MAGRRRIVLHFDRFGVESLDEVAAGGNWAFDELMTIASAYLARELGTDRIVRSVPRSKKKGEIARDVALDVNAEVWNELACEADRQGVQVERLIEHAALLFLADVESGHAAECLLRPAPDPSSSWAQVPKPREKP